MTGALVEPIKPESTGDRRLRIAMVAPERFPLPPREEFATAIEFLIQEMSQVLSEQHDVTIFSVAKRTGENGAADGIAYCYTPVTLVDTRVLPLLYRVGRRMLDPTLHYWQSIGYYGVYAARLALKIRAGKFDIVHLFNILQFAPWIRRFAPDSKVVFHIAWHGLSKREDYFGYSVLRTELAERCLSDVDTVIGCSDYLLRGIRERFPEHGHKLFCVYNGVKPSQVGERRELNALIVADREATVIFAGRIVPEKGLHTLLRAMHLVVRQIANARLQIVGVSWRPGAEFSGYEGELQRLAQGLEDHVEFLGWKSRAEFPKTLASGDVYAFPSIWEEPFSMSLLEAMAVGLPVVATATGGTPELIHDGVNGFLVPPDDPDGLADRLLMLLGNATLRREIGDSGRRLVSERYCWQRIVGEVVAVYWQTLGDGRDVSKTGVGPAPRRLKRASTGPAATEPAAMAGGDGSARGSGGD